MRKLRQYDITFSGLKQGVHKFDFHIDDRFFDLFENTDYACVCQRVSVVLDKKSTFMEMKFSSEGTINVCCDVTGEPFDMPIQGEMYLLVKFGAEYNDQDDQVLILPYGAYQLNVAQYIYEMIVLSIPAKRVHPDVIDGLSDSDMLKQLERYSVKNTDEGQNTDVDPRWEKLKSLLK